MNLTPLCEYHKRLGARMIPFAGFLMPVEYSGILDEHMTVRNHAGIFDVSHMGEFRVSGANALTLLQRITINDVSALKPGKVHYSCFPNGKGGIVDDLLVYKYSDTEFLLVVNASNTLKDWEWVNTNNSEGATLENISDLTAQIALQGPAATDIMQKLTGANLSALNYYSFITCSVAGINNVLISTTGYTGEPGYEIYIPPAEAGRLWLALLEEGKKYGLKPIGLGARDTLRLEAGMCLYGNDIDDTTSPLEAGLQRYIKFNAKDFIDKEYMLAQQANGLNRKLTGFIMLEKGIPRHDYDVCDGSARIIGKVTSGTISPVLNTGIGMAYIHPEYNAPGTEIFIKIRNRLLKAKVTNLPFINKTK